MRKSQKMKMVLFLSCIMLALVTLQFLPSEALAFPSEYANNCAGCHSAATSNTCDGCHKHGGSGLGAATDKTSYLPGETVTATLSGGSKGGWIRARLYDQTGTQVATSNGNDSGYGGSTTFPATLSAAAPTAPGTYTWEMAYYGNNDGGGHAEVRVTANSFSVTALPGADTDDDGDGFTENQGDCNDADNTIFPGASEVCDGVDRNCNGMADEGYNACGTCGVAPDTDGDGTIDCNDGCPTDPNKTAPGTAGCGNPEPADNTSTGTNVSVQPTPEVKLMFDNVSTAGISSAAPTTLTNPPPAGTVIANTAWDISTTATYAQNVEVCVSYSDADVTDEAVLQLRHYAGSIWSDITSSRNAATNEICGLTSSFSPFVIIEPVGTPPAATRVPILNGWWILAALGAGVAALRRRKQ